MKPIPSRKCVQGNWHLSRIVDENGQCLYQQQGLICDPRWVLARCRDGALHPSKSIDVNGKCDMWRPSNYAGWGLSFLCHTGPLDTGFIAQTFRVSNRAAGNPKILNDARFHSHLTHFFDGLAYLSEAASTRFGGRRECTDNVVDDPLLRLTRICVEINVLVNELITGQKRGARKFKAPDPTIPIISLFPESDELEGIDEDVTLGWNKSTETKVQLLSRGIEHSDCGLTRESQYWFCPLADVFELMQPTELKKAQRHLFPAGTWRSHPMFEYLLDDDSLGHEFNSSECPMRDIFEKWQQKEQGIRRYRQNAERRRLLRRMQSDNYPMDRGYRPDDTPLTDLSRNPDHTEAFGISEDDYPEDGAYYYDAADRREEADFRDDW